jgi:hypothetical protein
MCDIDTPLVIRRGSAALAALMLAACGTFGGGGDVSIVSASPTAVTVKYDEGALEKAQEQASNHCGSHARRSVLNRVTPGEGDERIGIFDCV